MGPVFSQATSCESVAPGQGFLNPTKPALNEPINQQISLASVQHVLLDIVTAAQNAHCQINRFNTSLAICDAVMTEHRVWREKKKTAQFCVTRTWNILIFKQKLSFQSRAQRGIGWPSLQSVCCSNEPFTHRAKQRRVAHKALGFSTASCQHQPNRT